MTRDTSHIRDNMERPDIGPTGAVLLVALCVIAGLILHAATMTLPDEFSEISVLEGNEK